MNASIKKFAIDIVREAGELALSRFGNLEKSEIAFKAGDHSPVTQVDLAINKLLNDKISKKFPSHGILSEELKRRPGNGMLWVIDPIDGTGNYTRADERYSVTLALVKNQRIILGIIYFPSQKKFFVAERGEGVYVNNKKISIKKNSSKIPVWYGFSKYEAQIKKRLNVKFVSLKLPNRCATQDLVDVAQGIVDGVIYKKIHLWDYAAGVLMVEEMGGNVLNFSKKPYTIRSRNLIVYR